MLLAHLSDFHLFADASETSLVRPDVVEACRKVVADVAALSPAIDICLLTGDLTDGGSDADYALLKDVIAPIKAPIFVVPGNHDRRETMRAAFSDTIPFEPGPDLNYEVRHSGVRILALDTLEEGKIAGRLSLGQLEWLAGKLTAPTDELTLIIMHHPAFPSGIVPLDRMALIEGREQFGDIVAAYQGPLRIHSGHIHRPFQTMWKGVFCAVGGSPAFQHELTLDPSAQEPGIVSEPYAYFLHKIDGADTVSVHARYVSL
ncbi:MAG: metallophosphoesterase [Rhizobiaceae bacterium]|nr:metallophosphoesterase [Rhizobiaceae bacterium]